MFGTENEPKISEWKKKTRGIEHFFWGVGWKMNCLGKKMKPKISERKNRLENEIVILPLITSFSSVVKALAGGGGWTTGDDGLFIIIGS